MNKDPNQQQNISKKLKEGISQLTDAYNAWSGGLGTYSVQSVYAIIGANWAVHSRAEKILSNPYSKWSMAICISFIMFNIFFVGLITEMHYYRLDKAIKKPKWWLKESKEQNKDWPYTWKIEICSLLLRIVKVIAPFTAGFLFLKSII
jgi:hypothetical protein